MKVYHFETVQNINANIEDCWAFFSNPTNLQIITLDTMAFKTQYYDQKPMYEGQLITYTLKPLWGIKINWTTIITVCKENNYFIDEQRFGPYALWHHKHFFEATATGTKMTDSVHYALPFGFIGQIVNRIMVKKKLQEIFNYRRSKVDQIFSTSL